VLGRSAILRGVAADRRTRLALGAVVAVLVALGVSLAAPTTWFLWGPIALGIPHVLADVRYLVLAPYRRVALGRRDLVLAAGLLAFAVTLAPWLGAAVVIGAVALTPDARRRAAVLAPAIALAWVAWSSPMTTSYVILHVHNVVALVLFAALAQDRRVGCGLAIAALAITAAVLGGGLDAILPMHALDDLAGYVLPDAAFAQWSAAACARIALTFVFLQGVHYAVWLRLIPAAVRPHRGMRGFRASVRALERDCTAPLLVVIALAALALPALAVVGARDPQTLRALYVQLAGGHAYLELAVLARWLAT
jgi:hypothetical protein